jgi:hypothetical protein
MLAGLVAVLPSLTHTLLCRVLRLVGLLHT